MEEQKTRFVGNGGCGELLGKYCCTRLDALAIQLWSVHTPENERWAAIFFHVVSRAFFRTQPSTSLCCIIGGLDLNFKDISLLAVAIAFPRYVCWPCATILFPLGMRCNVEKK